MQGAWRVAAATAGDIALDLGKHVVRVASVETRGGRFALERMPDGAIAMPHLPPSHDDTKWTVTVARMAASDYDVALQDRGVRPAVTHEVAIASLEGRDLSTERGFNGQATLKARLERGGSLDVQATFALVPLELKATVDARGIDLVPARAYVAHFPSVALKSGLVSVKGTVSLQDRGGALRITYDGDAEVDRFATFDTLNREELLNWRKVKTTGIKLDFAPGAPPRLAIADVDVEGAYSRLFVNPEGKLNVQQLISATPDE